MTCDSSVAKLYHFENSSGYLDSNWKSNALCMWKYPVSDKEHPHNFFLTTELIGGHIWRNLSTEVDGGNGSSLLTFDWKKIGADAEFIFYFDNDTERDHIRICNCYTDLCPVDPIPISSGRHNATWDFRVRSSGNDIAVSHAWLDNINIPDIVKLNCTIIAHPKVCINSINTASVPYQEGATYSWNAPEDMLVSGANTNVLTWKAKNYGKITLKATVTKNGYVKSNHTEVDIIRSYIPKDANNSSIIEVLRRPCDIIYVAAGSNLQAINDALVQQQGKEGIVNKVLYLEDGKYGAFNISAKGIAIRAENKHKAVFDGNPSKNFDILLNNTSNVSVENIAFRNNRYGICVHTCINCNISNNLIDSFDDAGLIVVNSISGNINNNIIKSSKRKTNGIRLDNSSNFKIENNEIDVTNYYYYFDNQTYNSEDNENMIYIKKFINKEYINITDNLVDYWVKECKFCKAGTSSCDESILETGDSIWKACQ